MLSWEYPPHMVGGLGKHVLELASALADQGVEVHVVTPNIAVAPPCEPFALGGTVHRVAVPQLVWGDHDWLGYVREVNACLTLACIEIERDLGPFDILHCHDWLLAWSAITIKHAHRVPLVATIHSMEHGRSRGQAWSDQARAIDAVEWQLTYEAWRVIVASQYMAEQLHTLFRLPTDKIDVIHNGVTPPTRHTFPNHERAAFRRRWADDAAPIVFYVGRIVQEKGIDVLIDAIDPVLARHPGARFVVAGTGPMRDSLQHYALARGVAAHMHWTGYIADAERDRLFAVADVATFPSVYEPFGIVALEAMAHRCPVVVAATGGLREVVRLFDNGMTAHPGDAASLAWAINGTLDDPMAAKERAERAYDETKRAYSWREIARATTAVYRRVRDDGRQSGWAMPQIEQVL